MAEAAAPERQLKRALSAFDLTCIGIGAIIGTGIFALAGTAAAGEQAHAVGSIWKTPVLNFVQSWTTHAPLVFGRPGAGPAVMLHLWWPGSRADSQRFVTPNSPR